MIENCAKNDVASRWLDKKNCAFKKIVFIDGIAYVGHISGMS